MCATLVNIQEDQLNFRFLVFPEGISNSSRFPVFPGTADTLSLELAVSYYCVWLMISNANTSKCTHITQHYLSSRTYLSASVWNRMTHEPRQTWIDCPAKLSDLIWSLAVSCNQKTDPAAAKRQITHHRVISNCDINCVYQHSVYIIEESNYLSINKKVQINIQKSRYMM